MYDFQDCAKMLGFHVVAVASKMALVSLRGDQVIVSIPEDQESAVSNLSKAKSQIVCRGCRQRMGYDNDNYKPLHTSSALRKLATHRGIII